jgi:hypothetical protein
MQDRFYNGIFAAFAGGPEVFAFADIDGTGWEANVRHQGNVDTTRGQVKRQASRPKVISKLWGGGVPQKIAREV